MPPKLPPIMLSGTLRLPFRARCSILRPCGSHLRRCTPLFHPFSTSSVSAIRARYGRRDLPQYGRREKPPPTPTATAPSLDIDDFQALAEKDAADTAHAVACMKKHREEIEKLPVAQRKDACVRAAVGSRMFAWLLGEKLNDLDTMFRSDRALTDLLCWHMLGEGLEDYVWRYLELQEGSDSRPDSIQSGRLLVAIATAHFEWAERKSAEPPLRVLERAFKTFPVQRPLIPLKTFVSKIMEDRTLPPYPKELFDLFLDLRRKMHDGVFLKERLAKDLLWHPTTPDADPLLRYLQGDPSVYATMWQAPKPALSSIGSSILRACYILEHQGRIEDASWLKSMLESKFPEVWHKFDTIWKAMEKDPKLEGIRQRGKSQTT